MSSNQESVEYTVTHSCGHTRFWSAPLAAHDALGPVNGPRFLGGLSASPCVWCGGEEGSDLHRGDVQGPAPTDAALVMRTAHGFDWLVSKTSEAARAGAP